MVEVRSNSGPMVHVMHKRLPLRYSLLLLLPALSMVPGPARAQLVGDTAPPKQLANSAAAEQSPADSKPAGKKRLAKDFTLKDDLLWTDTGIDLQPGEHVVITAKGSFRYADAKSDNGPEGLSRGFKDLLCILPFNDAGRGALIARIGDADIAQAFLVGASKDIVSPITGRLALGINQAKSETGDGTYTVHVEVYTADATAGGTVRTISKIVDTIPGIDNSLFIKIPRRISDKDGNPGDMVNFLMLGSEAAMQKAFASAGWVKV